MPDHLSTTDDWLAEQQRRNRQTSADWAGFENHRRNVMALLLEAAASQPNATAVLLGAGNCNDIDLAHLATAFAAVQLIDWDGAALSEAISRQGVAGRSEIVPLGGVDLLSSNLLSDELRPAKAEPATDSPPAASQVAGSYGVVASLCVLSQLIETVAAGPAGGDPQVVPAVRAIRWRHLQLLVELLAPRGVGLLITDMVSSLTVPELRTADDARLAPLMADCIRRQNFFTGLNPAVLLDLLQRDPWFAARVEQVQPRGPWKWDLGSRQFAVYAIRFVRREKS